VVDYRTILYSVDQEVAIIRLNRPERRNALTVEMIGELNDAMARIDSDAAVRAAVITGEGQGFCVGQDVSTLAATSSAQSGEEVRELILHTYKPLILRLCTLPKPVIAAVNGAAAGAGMSLALACDLRMMADSASLYTAFLNIGLVPDAGSSWLLARMIGYSKAFELIVEGERISSYQALELGIANRVVPAASLMEEAMAWAQRLVQRPTYAVGLTKRLLLDAAQGALEETLNREADYQAQAAQSEDHREGVAAFLQKRAPVFQGR
jgi:2-(1,2-epoxy-1,2-dihydrophenyl)acetyl-CoA isomerase